MKKNRILRHPLTAETDVNLAGYTMPLLPPLKQPAQSGISKQLQTALPILQWKKEAFILLTRDKGTACGSAEYLIFGGDSL